MDSREYKEILNQDIDGLLLNEICIPQLPTDEPSQNTATTKLKRFRLSEAEKAMLSQLNMAKDSMVFNEFWRKRGAELHRSRRIDAETPGPPLTLEEVATLVWGPCFQSWTRACEDLKTGQIKLGEVDRLFRNLKGDSNHMRNEVVEMARRQDMPWVGERVRQISQYYQISQYRRGAEVIRKAKESLGVVTEFSNLDILLTKVYHNASLQARLSHCLSFIVSFFPNHLSEVLEYICSIFNHYYFLLDIFNS